MNKNNIIIICFFLLLLTIIYYINFFLFETQYSDILCVGAGVSSAYMCYKLKKNNINNNIIVIEKENILGGRLNSVYSNINHTNSPEVVFNELGAMRLFKGEEMKQLFDLLEELNLQTISVPIKDDNNIFYYKGQKFKKSDVLINNKKIKDFEDNMINNFKKMNPTFNYANTYEFEELSNISLRSFFKKYGNATDNDVDLWISYSGYDLYTDDVSVSNWLIDKDFYNSSKSDSQVYLKDGIVSIAKKLFKYSNASICYNTKVMNIEKKKDGIFFIHTLNNKNKYVCYKCKHLVLGMGSADLLELNTIKKIPVSNERIEMIKYIKPFPLFKCFLKWDTDKIWWGKDKKFSQGKSTTDLIVRQVHYYNDEDILIYNSNNYAKKLYDIFNENSANGLLTIYNDIKQIHDIDIPEPNFNYVLYKYWKEGSHKWRNGSDILLFTKVIPDGKIDNSNIYIIGDSFSEYQGWIIGAIKSVDIAFKKLQQEFV